VSLLLLAHPHLDCKRLGLCRLEAPGGKAAPGTLDMVELTMGVRDGATYKSAVAMRMAAAPDDACHQVLTLNEVRAAWRVSQAYILADSLVFNLHWNVSPQVVDWETQR
jgi:hypothetical protein